MINGSIQVSHLGRNLGKFLKSYRSQNIGDSFPVSVPFSATGGDYVLTPGNGYKYHTFTSSGSFVTEGGPHTVEYILVAGGGGGGGYASLCFWWWRRWRCRHL